MTEPTKNIYTALCAAQAGMGTVVKGATNPAFKTKYADLADVVAVVVPALSAQGIAMYHCMDRDESGLVMRTTLAHGESGTFIHCDVPLLVDRQNMQGMKSATTYAKRIGIESLTGVAPSDDDDGNAAAAAAPRQEPRQPAKPQEQSHAAQEAKARLLSAPDVDQLAHVWKNLPAELKAERIVLEAKDSRKIALTQKDAEA